MSTTKQLSTINRADLPRYFKGKEQEAKWSRFWEREKIYEYQPIHNRQETFVVDTPPPTVSGSLHLGHLFSYAHTDFMARFYRLKGKNIFYPMGWDDNGLPTERRVQNYFHVRCDPAAPYDPDYEGQAATAKIRKKPPQVISRRNFIELCNQLTREDEKVFKVLWTRLGLSVDWNLEYATISPFSQKIAQMSFLDLYQKGHIYSKYAPVMWDVNFQTSIAQAEIEDRDSPGFLYNLKFLTEKPDLTFTISTSRPELLPACVGVACHPEDKRYQQLIDQSAITPLFGVKVPIFASEKVDPEKGTGIVMVCTFGDTTDVEWWEEEQLALRQIIGLDGKLLSVEFGSEGWESEYPDNANGYYQQLVGLPIKKARASILELLSSETPPWQGFPSLTTEPKPIERMVKFYEKGDAPLEIIPTRQWFVKLLDKKEALIEKGEQIRWHPDYFHKRFESWTENLQYDWNISRQRFFGVPMPVWYPLDKQGSRLLDQPIFPDVDQLPIDPMIDTPPGYTETQRDQPLGFQGEKDVFDTWFTSSMSPQIATKWTLGNQHKELFPFDIRPQSHEIIRTWAFYTIAKAMLHEDTIPWKHVLISGWILDPDRKKMSKSKGNVETPDYWLDQYSADAVRYWAAKAKLGVDTTFDPNVMKIGQRLVNKIYNVGKFVYGQPAPQTTIIKEIDRAFIAALKDLALAVTEAFEAFDHAKALILTETFFWSKFTDTYVELIKKRTFDERPEYQAERGSAVAALRVGLSILLRLFAPFLPYITEEVWSWIAAEESNCRSIHIAPWPSDKAFENVGLPNNDRSFEVAIECLENIHRFKAQNGLSVGTEVSALEISADKDRVEILHLCLDDIQNAARAGIIELKVDERLSNHFGISGTLA